MFGMGGTEILVILVVALLFLGPDKLPEAAKQISKGIRDIKKQSRALQQTIEDDEHIGGAIRDLKSALRGEDLVVRPRPMPTSAEVVALPMPGTPEAAAALAAHAAANTTSTSDASDASEPGLLVAGDDRDDHDAGAATGATTPEAKVTLTMPPVAGERDADEILDPDASARADAELAALVKPAPNTIPRGSSVTGPGAASDKPGSEHG